jgi:hypothetical protein
MAKALTPAQKRANTIAAKRASQPMVPESVREIVRQELNQAAMEKVSQVAFNISSKLQEQLQVQQAADVQQNCQTAPPQQIMQDRTREMIGMLRHMVKVTVSLQDELDDKTNAFRRPFCPMTGEGSEGSDQPLQSSVVLADLQDLANDIICLTNRQRYLIEALS